MESIIAILIILGIIKMIFGKALGKKSRPDYTGSSGSKQSQMTFSDLYYELDLQYNDDDDPDFDDEGDNYYDDIVNEVWEKTGRRPKDTDIVPEWGLEKYDYLL